MPRVARLVVHEYRIGGTVGGGRDATYALCRGALTYVSVRDIGTYYALRLPFGRQAQLMRMKYMSNLSGSQGKLIVELENWQVYTGKCVCVSACDDEDASTHLYVYVYVGVHVCGVCED